MIDHADRPSVNPAIAVGAIAATIFIGFAAWPTVRDAIFPPPTRDQVATRYCDEALRQVVLAPDTYRREGDGFTMHDRDGTILGDVPVEFTSTLIDFVSVNRYNAPVRSSALCTFSWTRYGDEISTTPSLEKINIDGHLVGRSELASARLHLDGLD